MKVNICFGINLEKCKRTNTHRYAQTTYTHREIQKGIEREGEGGIRDDVNSRAILRFKRIVLRESVKGSCRIAGGTTRHRRNHAQAWGLLAGLDVIGVGDGSIIRIFQIGLMHTEASVSLADTDIHHQKHRVSASLAPRCCCGLPWRPPRDTVLSQKWLHNFSFFLFHLLF